MPRVTETIALLAAAALPVAIWCQSDQINARDAFYSAADLLDKPHPAEYQAPPAKPTSTATPKTTGSTKTGPSAKGNRLQVAASPLGVRYSILKQSGPDQFVEAAPGTAFHAGDRLRLSVMANQRGYLYIIEKGSTSEWRALFPDPKIHGGNKCH
jgi:hypothetical protein